MDPNASFYTLGASTVPPRKDHAIQQHEVFKPIVEALLLKLLDVRVVLLVCGGVDICRHIISEGKPGLLLSDTIFMHTSPLTTSMQTPSYL